MMRLKSFISFVAALAVVAARSPLADPALQQLLANDATGRYSNNVIEDARLDVPELVRKYNYPLEEHTVTTSDGYVLTLHRIPHGRDAHSTPGPRPVIFLMHGIVCSSADWVITGPGSGLAYILAEEGFDVWMGNARGNYYSRRHVSLNPDSIRNKNFWDFSWDEIGEIDVPTMIDYVLETTEHQRLHYIGHSQGTTVFFVMTSLKPEYNDKIISMHALAPVAFMEHNQSWLLKAISPYASDIDKVARRLGLGEMVPNNQIMTWAGQKMCMDEVKYQPLCSNILFLIGGWNENQHNATIMPVIMGHTPAGSSTRQFAHYGQGIADKQFRRYDLGRRKNRKRYGSRSPPTYDLKKITTPVFLHYSLSDPLAHVRDVDRLWRELGRPVGKFMVNMQSFSHTDFMWAIDARALIYNRVINLIWQMDGLQNSNYDELEF
ncbi:hypothetical protein JYU34_021155 [Plutella xylostella]|uniref:Lipase n=1 Tax=Plutella xylostella TaxID=51655 RepID=A0ABQ7PTE6_PLUXY|nr:hypothetical protein JYU34_021155 [Plutella xylostella]